MGIRAPLEQGESVGTNAGPDLPRRPWQDPTEQIVMLRTVVGSYDGLPPLLQLEHTNFLSVLALRAVGQMIPKNEEPENEYTKILVREFGKGKPDLLV